MSALASSRPEMGTGTFWQLTVTYGLASAHFWMTVPLAAIALAERGVPAWQIGLVGSVPWLALVLLVPFVPAFAARQGPIMVFRIGVWLAVAGAALFLVSHELVVWTIAYALTGAGIALRWIVGDALVGALAPEGQRGHRVGLYEMAVGATMAIGPLILTVFGASTISFSIGLALVLAAAVMTETIRLPAFEFPLRTLRESFGDIARAVKAAPFTLMVAAMAGFMEGAATKLFPVQAVGLGMAESIASATVVAIGAGNIFLQYPVGRFADRLGTKRVTLVSLALLALCAVALPFVVAAPFLYLAVLAALGGIIGALYTLSVVGAGAMGSMRDAMSVLAVISLGYTAGSVFGPITAGALTSFSLLYGLPVLLIVGAAVLAAGLLRTSRQARG